VVLEVVIGVLFVACLLLAGLCFLAGSDARIERSRAEAWKKSCVERDEQCVEAESVAASLKEDVKRLEAKKRRLLERVAQTRLDSQRCQDACGKNLDIALQANARLSSELALKNDSILRLQKRNDSDKAVLDAAVDKLGAIEDVLLDGEDEE